MKNTERSNSPKLSIIIVNYNGEQYLDSCLRSILSQTYCNFEIIVVDNASSDGSAEYIKSHFPEVQIIESAVNLGFSRGNNIGFEQARGEYVLLLNPDTIALPGALLAMADFLSGHQEAGAVGCRLVDAEGNVQPSAGYGLNLAVIAVRLFRLKRCIPIAWLKQSRLRGFLPRTGHLAAYDQVREAAVLNGACIMTRRKVIDQVGGLDENFFMYYEESDWCRRMQQHGWRLYFTPEGEIIHLIGQSAQKFKSITFLAEYHSLLHYFRKHHSRAEVSLLRVMVVVRIVFLLAKTLLKCLLDPKKERTEYSEQMSAQLGILRLYLLGRPICLPYGV